tara:strand:- start:238 stop:438 length:201 start_codon:yes stop_codon:yes gene_type:complete
MSREPDSSLLSNHDLKIRKVDNVIAARMPIKYDRYLKTGLNFMKYFETYKQKILLVLELTILVKLT